MSYTAKYTQGDENEVSKKNEIKDEILINGLDVEAWIEGPLEDTGPSIEETTLKYDKKLVAFLDLLGITSKIQTLKNGAEKEIISTMEKIKSIVDSELKSAPESSKINMLYISDSFIFVCDKELLPYFLRILSNIQMRILVECHTMLRGALEYGDVIIRDEGKQIIGPAYIEAYLKQEHHAIFPRIIIGNSVVLLINSSVEVYDKIIVSRDRETSLDYVDVYMEIEKKNKKEITTRLRREGIYDYLCKGYKEFNEQNNSSVRAKYAWTINYLKEKGVWSNATQYNYW